MHSNTTSLHGLFMNIFGVGTLITGESGIGKSEIALTLLDKQRGHQLIADDNPEFYCLDGTKVLGRSPELLKSFLEVSGIGVINIEKVFGNEAILKGQALSLIVNLKKACLSREPKSPMFYQQTVLNIPITAITLPITHRMDIRIEIIAQHYLQQLEPNMEFLQKHKKKLGILL